MGSDAAETTGSLGQTIAQSLPMMFALLVVGPAQLSFGIEIV